MTNPMLLRISLSLIITTGCVILSSVSVQANERISPPDSTDFAVGKIANQIDQLIEKNLIQEEKTPSELVNDEDFLRRASFDLIGGIPNVDEITEFGLNPDESKRADKIEELLARPEFAQNWARYWRDVIYSRATDPRSLRQQPVFQKWMAEQIEKGESWDKITSSLITATGDASKEGSTALMYAHSGNAVEIASETSRIFMGIQIQCAQCHDSKDESWKREQFHQLAAFFPRMIVKRNSQDKPRTFSVLSNDPSPAKAKIKDPFKRFEQLIANPQPLFKKFDSNNDQKLQKKEVANAPFGKQFGRILKKADQDGDKALSVIELKSFKPPKPRRNRSGEHFMPDLNDPSSKGTKIDPVFFVSNKEIETGLSDQERRQALAKMITSPENEWFAKAYVNRIWSTLNGHGFYEVIDDMGPERYAMHQEVIDLLSQGFVANGYDMKWVYRVIMNTQTYQRQIADPMHSDLTDEFAANTPVRLRADHLFDSLICALEIQEPLAAKKRGKGLRGNVNSARSQFQALFGHDPSATSDETSGTIPQTLFMMNSPRINRYLLGKDSVVGKLVETFENDDDVTTEIYLKVLGREPHEEEEAIMTEYLAEVGDRQEAFEDLYWSLLNSTEFMTKR